MTATVPTTLDVLRLSPAEERFRMLKESSVLFKIKSLLLSFIDSSSVLFVYLQIQVQNALLTVFCVVLLIVIVFEDDVRMLDHDILVDCSSDVDNFLIVECSIVVNCMSVVCCFTEVVCSFFVDCSLVACSFVSCRFSDIACSIVVCCSSGVVRSIVVCCSSIVVCFIVIRETDSDVVSIDIVDIVSHNTVLVELILLKNLQL